MWDILFFKIIFARSPNDWKTEICSSSRYQNKWTWLMFLLHRDDVQCFRNVSTKPLRTCSPLSRAMLVMLLRFAQILTFCAIPGTHWGLLVYPALPSGWCGRPKEDQDQDLNRGWPLQLPNAALSLSPTPGSPTKLGLVCKLQSANALETMQP